MKTQMPFYIGKYAVVIEGGYIPSGTEYEILKAELLKRSGSGKFKMQFTVGPWGERVPLLVSYKVITPVSL